jgi:hypothetical protein
MCGFGRGGRRLRERKKEREKRETTVGGLNAPGSASDRTLSRLAGLYLVRTLCPRRDDILERIKE